MFVNFNKLNKIIFNFYSQKKIVLSFILKKNRLSQNKQAKKNFTSLIND